MSVTDPSLPWDDPAWAEKGDNAWQAQLRRQQAWWRAKRLGLPAGPRAGHPRLVASMLPDGVGLEPNLMSAEAVKAALVAQHTLKAEGRPGLIQEERLRRNLLSSQPLCFNLFGHLGTYPVSLLPWVRGFQPAAVSVGPVRLEWAPSSGALGGSAFDAFVAYATADGKNGFVGVEVKYAENLASAQPKPAHDKYEDATLAGPWKSGAAERLDQSRLRQFWYNQLLAQVVLASGEYDEGAVAVVACAADHTAREVTATVAAELADPSTLRFASIEDLVASVQAEDSWKARFIERYLTIAERR